MKRKSFASMRCPIARGLERVGEWWSMLILREAIRGRRRFDEFQMSLPIAPNMLTRRLAALVRSGLLARRRYCAHPPRYAYELTDRGRDFFPVLVALLNWGNKHFPPTGIALQIVDARTGLAVHAVMIDPGNGQPLNAIDYQFGPPAPPRAVPLRPERQSDVSDPHRLRSEHRGRKIADSREVSARAVAFDFPAVFPDLHGRPADPVAGEQFPRFAGDGRPAGAGLHPPLRHHGAPLRGAGRSPGAAGC